jgi:hypothetical protein
VLLAAVVVVVAVILAAVAVRLLAAVVVVSEASLVVALGFTGVGVVAMMADVVVMAVVLVVVVVVVGPVPFTTSVNSGDSGTYMGSATSGHRAEASRHATAANERATVRAPMPL